MRLTRVYPESGARGYVYWSNAHKNATFDADVFQMVSTGSERLDGDLLLCADSRWVPYIRGKHNSRVRVETAVTIRRKQ